MRRGILFIRDIENVELSRLELPRVNCIYHFKHFFDYMTNFLFKIYLFIINANKKYLF